jgi:4-hydroxy-2-oxoglutarate aldolase
MKDSSTAMMVDYILSAGGRADFDILAGSLSTLMICLTLGGSGGVVSAANYFPSQCAHITDLYFSGQHKEAVASFLELERVVKEAAVKYSVAGLKCCMNLCGFSGGRPRLPVKPLSAEQENEVKAVLLRNHMIEA